MEGRLSIHTENILPIIKKWLYSDRDIFLRELVSNASDALQKVKILSEEGELTAKEEGTLSAKVHVDRERKALIFEDNGIGMDAEEVEKYISQIAFSGAEEFVKKYKSKDEKEHLIGHFGLGFYSAFMVAKEVEIDTLSYKEGSKPVKWRSSGQESYTIEKGARAIRGTSITLFLDDESLDYLEEKKLREVLDKHCRFLAFPIFLEEERINDVEPLWLKAPSECTAEEYKTFYRAISSSYEEPLFWIHINVDYPFRLKGILYFPKGKRPFELKKSTVQLYCNRVFVSDNCKDIIPDYLQALEGVIDSPDIPLNVSRSYLQMDKTVRLLSGHISKKVSDSLVSLFRSDRSRYESLFSDLSLFIKLGVIEDEKFYERMKEALFLETVDQEKRTLDEMMGEKGEKKKFFYTSHKNLHPEVVATLKTKGEKVLLLDQPIDPYLISALERHLKDVEFARVDSDLSDLMEDKSREKTLLDESQKTEATHIADFFRQNLTAESIEVEAKSLASDEIPALLLMDEKERRFRDHMLQQDPKFSDQLFGSFKKKMVVNTNHPLVIEVRKWKDKEPEIAENMVQEIYDMASLAQGEMKPETVKKFMARTLSLLNRLSEKALK